MELIRIEKVAEVGVSLIPEAEQRRDMLLGKSAGVMAVNDPAQQEEAMGYARRIKRALNDVEAARKAVKRPVLDLEDRIDGIAKSFVASMRAELDRLMLLVNSFQSKERFRVQREEETRSAEVRRLREQEEAARQELAAAEARLAKPRAGMAELARAEEAQQAVFDTMSKAAVAASAPPEAVERTTGMLTRTVVEFEVTDATALYAARPDFFELTPKRSVIRSSITKHTLLPGLKVWEEVKTGVRE